MFRFFPVFCILCVLAVVAGAAEYRWDFSASAVGRSGNDEISPSEPAVRKDGALLTADAPVRYRLPAGPAAAAGMLRIRFALPDELAPDRESCLLDAMQGGNGLRLWITRDGNFACDFREGWKGRTWWTMPVSKLKSAEWHDLELRWSADLLQIRFDGRTVFEKRQPALPGKWGNLLTLGAFSDGKAAAPFKIASLVISDRTGEPEPEVGKTFVRPAARRVKPVFGLCIHTRNSPRELPAVAGSGVRRVRFHFSWNEAETEKGTLQLPQSAFDFMKALDDHGQEALMILAYGNKHYTAPGTSGGFDELKGQGAAFHEGFGRYARYMASVFGSRGSGQVREWEIWNEQNGASPEEYLAVLRPAVQNIREADPEAKIIFGGISRMDHAFLKRCFELGAGELVDAVAIHPYREEVPPEYPYQSLRRFDGKTSNYAEELLAMRETVDRLSPPGKRIPLWITEFGYWTLDSQPSLDPKTSVTHDVQAKYLLRSMLQNLALGVDNYYVYRAVDSAFFGLTYGPNYLPRPGYFALQHLNRLFPPGSEFDVLDLETKVSADEKNRKLVETLYGAFDPHVYLFRKADGGIRLVLWNGGRAGDRQTELPVADVELPLDLVSGPVGVYDLFLGSDRAWYTSEPVRAAVESANGASRIRGIKFCDTPVVLELKTK